ncbi:hypothetical protein [Billgrantia antri]|uniref:hypothetical protein n=1 Tax=Billgrantia antri TaxID=2846777 RepID=UPI003B218A64
MQLEGASLAAFNQLRDVYNTAGELADAKVVELEALTLARIRMQQFGVFGFAFLVFVAAVAIALVGPMLMSRAIRQITGRMDTTLQTVRSSTLNVNNASNEIAKSSQDLSSRTEQTAANLQQIVASIERITDVISEISAGAKEQSQGIAQVNIAVSELDNMTQHNALLVEQTSAAADEMREQVERLNDLIASFRLSDACDTERNLLPTPKCKTATVRGHQDMLPAEASF